MALWLRLQSGTVTGKSTVSSCLSIIQGPMWLGADFHLMMDLNETVATPMLLCHLEPELQECNWNISSDSGGALAAKAD